MRSNLIHVCLEVPEAPAPDAEFEDGTRWVCPCGSHFVYHEGFNRAGYMCMDWWPAPPLIPAPRKAREVLRAMLVHPRQG